MPQLRYTKDHEYIRVDGADGVVGISEHAQQQLGDIVFAEPPPVGKALKRGDPAAVVESVKAASEVYAPVSGEVTASNAALVDDPAKVNADPEGEGWFFKLKLSNKAEFAKLMNDAQYKEFLKGL